MGGPAGDVGPAPYRWLEGPVVRSEMPLVGRDDELRLIGDSLAVSRRGQGRLILIDGEAGSGKTTLLAAVMRGARGFVTLQAAAHEIDRDRPFGVIVDALAIGGTSRDDARRAVAGALRSAGTSGYTETVRYGIVEDVVALVERSAMEQPLLLLLDDVQWADDPSLLALHHLARRMADLPVCLILARRPPSAGVGGPDALSDLAYQLDASRISLEPLSASQVAELAANLLGAAPSKGLQSLLAKAGGNPFYVTELLSALREERSIDIVGTQADVAALGIRPELRMVILRRLSGLAMPTTSALRMAAILGETFSAADLAVSLATTAADLAGPLKEALSAGVLTDEGPRLAFRHDLVREAIYGDIPGSLRNALHLQVAHALQATGAPASNVAPHYERGAAAGDDAAIACLRSAAAEVGLTEPATARRWLTRALDLIPLPDERRDEVVFELCQIALRTGDSAGAERLARASLARPQTPTRRSALARALAAALDLQDRCLDAAAVSDRESARNDLSPVERIRLAAEAVEYRGHMERVGAGAAAGALLERALQIGDDVAIRGVLAAMYHAALWSGDFAQAVELAERVMAVPETSDSFIVTTGGIGGALVRAGRTDEGLRSLKAEIRFLEERGDVRPMALVLNEITMVELRAGHWDEAISDAEAALGLTNEFRQEVRHDESAALLAILFTRRGQHERAAEVLASLRSTRQFVAAIALAAHTEAVGDPKRALDILRGAWALATEMGRISDLPRYAPGLVRLELRHGEAQRADDAAGVVERLALDTGVMPTRIVGLRCRGLVSGDPAVLLEAAQLAAEADNADDEAQLFEEAGVVLGATRKLGEALPLLERALEYYERIGAMYDYRRTEAAIRALGVRRGRRGRRARAAVGWESLSDTERDV
ncbi:MAG: hypothetical protein QOJ81_2227, partial [Chloroflexota bacterium]|nr:hypothetical protein [Chloroflexota bacterium]